MDWYGDRKNYWLHRVRLANIADLLAVETFRAEENQLPAVVKFAAILEIVWFSGLFGLMKTASRPNSGGFVGDILEYGYTEKW